MRDMNSIDEKIINEVATFTHDPLGYVNWAFDWGKGELEYSPGPRTWQKDILKTIGEELRKNQGKKNQVVKIAIASGHGIGKSCLMALVNCWGLSTLEDCRGRVTANTGNQLKSTTWAELSKWWARMLNKDWFTVTATGFYSNVPDHNLNWRTDAVVWRENSTEGFAGLHNKGRRIIIEVDEASGVPQAVFDVIDSFTFEESTEIIILVFGNPTRNSGPFYDIFHKNKAAWITKQIDSRTVEGANQEEIAKQIELHGIDSNWVKTRILGEFSNTSSMQFIPTDLVKEARMKDATSTNNEPLILGIDLARGGDDNCVFYFRRGRDAKSIKPIIIPGSEVADSTRLEAIGIDLFNRYQPDYIFGDAGGLGAPILDHWKKLGYNIFHINFGGSSPKDCYHNMTAYMGSEFKDWLKTGGAIWDDPRLEDDLCMREFDYMPDGSTLFLESKKDMKKRGLSSPDISDALWLTFSSPVPNKNVMVSTHKNIQMKNTLKDYNPLAHRLLKH
jgi:hypothetical protein